MRGLAILLVLFHHLFVFEAAGPMGIHLAVYAEFAGHGVDLFFALSGFLIAQQLAIGRSKPGHSFRFWVRRCAKIIPLYLLGLLIVFVLLKPLLGLTGHPEKLHWLVATEANWPWYLFFISNLLNAVDGRFTNPALDVCWSLAIEVHFYLLAYFVSRVAAPARWPRLALVAIAVAIVFRAGCLIAGASWVSVLVLTPGRLDAFAFGVLAATAPAWLARCPGWMVWCVIALPLFTPWSRAHVAVEVVGYTLVALAAGISIERACRPAAWLATASPLSHRYLATLGKLSYSIYLTHLPVRAVLRDKFLPSTRLLDTPLAWMLQTLFWIGAGGICVFTGWLTWRFIEEPARLKILTYFQTPARAIPAGVSSIEK